MITVQERRELERAAAYQAWLHDGMVRAVRRYFERQRVVRMIFHPMFGRR